MYGLRLFIALFCLSHLARYMTAAAQAKNTQNAFPQTITDYSCSTVGEYGCWSSENQGNYNYEDVASYATYVPVAFMMIDQHGNGYFDPGAPILNLNGRAAISLGGSGQNPNYCFDNVDNCVQQIVTEVDKNEATAVDVDLEQLSGIDPSLMISLLTKLHNALPKVKISVAPECPGVSTAAGPYVPGSGSVYNYWVQILNACDFLEVFIQTYNNWCSNYPMGSVENLLQILSDWINANPAIKYNGYNPKQIVLGLCGRDNDPTACSNGFVTATDVKTALVKAIDIYGCTVGAGLWASYADTSGISQAIYDVFNQYCSLELSSSPSASPTTPTPSLRPTTNVPTTLTPTGAPSTVSPTTQHPTNRPTTLTPTAVSSTVSPTTAKPIFSPTNSTLKHQKPASTSSFVLDAAKGVALAIGFFAGSAALMRCYNNYMKKPYTSLSN